MTQISNRIATLPFLALVGFVFTLPWQNAVFLPGGRVFSIARLAGAALMLAGVLSLFRANKMHFRQPPLLLLSAFCFVFWATLSSLWNVHSPNGALLAAVIYVQLAVMMWAIWQLCRTQEQHLILLQAFVLGAFVLVGSILQAFLADPFVPNTPQGFRRYTSFDGNPNDVAAIIALSLPVAWYLAIIRKKGVWYWFNTFYIPVALLAIVLTASRGGFVTALVGLGVVPLTLGTIPMTRRLLIGIVFGVLVAGVVSTVPLGNFARVAETTTELTEGNVSNRSQIWRAGLEIYSQNPILGIGVGGFSRGVAPLLRAPLHAHNAFIAVLTEMGIIGATLFTLNFVIALLPVLNLPGPHRAFYTVLWVTLIVSMLSLNFENAQHTWALLMLFATRRAYVLKPSVRPSKMHALNPSS
jgi:O-antigen ligase